MATLKEALKLFRLKKYELALNVFLKLDIAPQSNKQVAYYMSVICFKLKKYTQTVAYLKETLNQETNPISVLNLNIMLACTYSYMGQSEDVFKILGLLKEKGYKLAQVESIEIYNLILTGDLKKALEIGQESLKNNENNSNLLNSVGYVLAELGENLELALDYCKKVIKKNPENANYLDSLGWVYFKLERYEEAYVYLKKASSLDPSNTDISMHVKELYAKTNKE